MSKIGIVVPVLTNFRGAVEAIESADSSHDLITLFQPQWRMNRPLSEAWNHGIDSAISLDCDYILVINDDILFAPHTIDNMVNVFESFGPTDPNIVMVTGCNNRGTIDDVYGGPYGTFNLPFEEVKPESFAEHPDFSCFMIKPDFFLKVGRFDENFVPAYFEDNDMHRRIILSGNKAICTYAAPYYHYGSVTGSSPKVQNHETFRSCAEYYVEKWGGGPSQEKWTNPFNNPLMSYKDWQ